MNDHELQQRLNSDLPSPDAITKARHKALAMAAFKTAQEDATAPNNAESASSTKKLTFFQGLWQWLRLTREPHSHGSNTMNTRHQNTSDHQPAATTNNRAWPKPMLFSAIAASSLLVVGGLTFMQQLMISPNQEQLERAIAQHENAQKIPLNMEAEEVVVAGMRADIIMADDAKRESQPMAEIPSAAMKLKAQDLGKVASKRMMQPMLASPAVAGAPPAMALNESTENFPAQRPKDNKEYRDKFADFDENPVVAVSAAPVSTFSIDVDTAAYSFVRRLLNSGQLPPKDSVRTEELINYFDYAYPQPKDRSTPFATYTTVLDSPWTKGNKLIHIGIQGYQLPASEIPQSNLVFLLDVSGSMNEPDKLPLVKQSMELLLNTLRPEDTIAIVVYAGAAGTVLEPTKVKEKQKILASLQQLEAGGSTAGAEGIARAYQLAEANFNPKGVNRIILATDGDFNVGETGEDNLQDFVERKREKGIYLSVLGFGQGNYQDALMQTLAQNGNGVAAYIDTLSEAQKVLVNEATANLFPIAQDVKIQVEFNPATVAEYRLIGYETRALAQEDFNNDKVDAGEIGAGSRVTAIYEVTPVTASSKLLEPRRYQPAANKPAIADKNELAFVRIRYKLPGANKSALIETPVSAAANASNDASFQQEIKFATAVAGFAQLLRGSKYSGDFDYDKVIALAQANKGTDNYGYRTEFIQLVRKAKIAKE